MPNWITNVIQAPETVINALLSPADDNHEEPYVDFNNIVPMPENVFRGDLGRKEKEMFPGELNWYGFGIANWGTKWNACKTIRISEDRVSFQTAWSHPEPIIKALSEKFPEDTILVAYADEDLGYNFGVYEIKNGVITETASIGEGSNIACEFSSVLVWDRSYKEFIEENIDYAQDNPEEELEKYQSELEDYNDEMIQFKNHYPDVDFSNFKKVLDVGW